MSNTNQTPNGAANVTTTLNDLTYGIEIETVTRSGHTFNDVARAIQSVIGGHIEQTGGYYRKVTVVAPGTDAIGAARRWTVMSDASISAPYNSQGAEIVSPVLAYSDVEELQEIVRAVRRVAKVNESCGIHVHVGAQSFDAAAITRLVRSFHANEELITLAAGVNVRRLNSWCQPVCSEFLGRLEANRPATMDALKDAWYGYDANRRANVHYDDSRYRALNLHAVWQKGTVEFRLFEATLHAGKVKSYLQFCGALACKAINSSRASSKKRDINPNATRAAFRTFIRGLKLDGNEFKTLRLHLLNNDRLTGWSAFAAGRPNDAWAIRHGRTIS